MNWTAGKPTRAGWYWWRSNTEDDASICYVKRNERNGEWVAEFMDDYIYFSDLTHGEFLVPISPTDRQQGRVEGRKEMLESFEKHHDNCNDFRHCECAGGFWYEQIGEPWMDEKAAQQAQEGANNERT